MTGIVVSSFVADLPENVFVLLDAQLGGGARLYGLLSPAVASGAVRGGLGMQALGMLDRVRAPCCWWPGVARWRWAYIPTPP